MDNGQRSKWRRYEAKYLIDAFRADHIREHCLKYLPHDPYSASQPDGCYPISSIYLDSPDRHCLRGTVERRANRFKLRIRHYCDRANPADDTPVFYEIKRKTDGVVGKTRARVTADLAHQLVAAGFPAFVTNSDIDPKTRNYLNEFLDLCNRTGASPNLGVYYSREAFEDPEDRRVRISIDRDLHYGILVPGTIQCDSWWPVHMTHLILEIKFTNSFPEWVSDLVHHHEVNRRGVCKYLMCSQWSGHGVRSLHT